MSDELSTQTAHTHTHKQTYEYYNVRNIFFLYVNNNKDNKLLYIINVLITIIIIIVMYPKSL